MSFEKDTSATSGLSPERGEIAQPLWCVHVRGPDDLVPVASYEDAVLLADSINWWWQGLDLRSDNEPIMSALPALYDGSAEDHAKWVAKLGTPAAEYEVPTAEKVDALRLKAFEKRIEKDKRLREVTALPEPVQDGAETDADRLTLDVVVQVILATGGDPKRAPEALSVLQSHLAIQRTTRRAATPSVVTDLFEALHIESLTRGWFAGPNPHIDGYLDVLRLRLKRALRSPASEPPRDEPVAWQWRLKGEDDSGWLMCGDGHDKDAHLRVNADRVEVRPLYAAPPAGDPS